MPPRNNESITWGYDMCVLCRLLGILLVGLAVPAASFAGNVGARFTTDRATYLLGEQFGPNARADGRAPSHRALGRLRCKRQAAVSSLFLLTHRAALDKSSWSDVTTSEGAAAVHARWVAWWRSHGSASEMHGM